MNFQEFCAAVGKVVKEKYGLDDGSGMCFNLYEAGVVTTDDGVDAAARIVAQHLEQQ